MIRRAGIEELVAQCGGSCACATCQCLHHMAEGVTLAEMGPLKAVCSLRQAIGTLRHGLSCQIKFDAKPRRLHVCIAPEIQAAFSSASAVRRQRFCAP